jgi:DNA-binding MarR family transcriptional regulator
MNNDHVEKIYQIMKQMHMLRSNIQPVGDISHSEFFMLKVICKHSTPLGLSMSNLSELLKISKPAVSQMVNSLEDKGYVERFMPKSDRRLVLVRLTEAGQQGLDREMQVFTDRLVQTFAKLGEEDTEELFRLLTRLYSILKDQFPDSRL